MEDKKLTKADVMQWLIEEEECNKPHKAKRVKFPTAKKSNPTPNPPPNPNAAPDLNSARLERQKRRFLNNTNIDFDEEFEYENKGDFVEGGIQFEAFDLEQEMNEGYFDENWNFVEYAADEEEKDAWLDSLDEADANATNPNLTNKKDNKRGIDKLLEPQETVLLAFKRLKGDSDDGDYVYDENSGYYYSNSMWYYYDLSLTLYCCATTGQWYSFNESTGEYNEVH